MRLLLLLLLAAAPLAAHEPPQREPFPSDYLVSPCAPSAEEMCSGVKKVDIAQLAFRFRGVTLDHGWIDAHWDEMKNVVFAPLCAKMANCYTIRGNQTVWCQDLFRQDFLAQCDSYAEGSEDRKQCLIFATTYFITLSVKTNLFRAAQQCALETDEPGIRKLEAWIVPDVVKLESDEPITVFAIDAERRIPVRARVTSDGGGALKSTDGPHPVTAIPATWKRKLRRVPNGSGHEDLVAPTLTITAEGYEPVQLALPVQLPKVIVEMTPAPHQLRRGVNKVTISARDAATGVPVEMRVMGGEMILGNTNVPFELPIGAKRPEIWLTSLFDLYSDVVVAPAR